jgi:pseudouridylate synthase
MVLVNSLKGSRHLNLVRRYRYHIVNREYTQSISNNGLSISPRVLDALRSGKPIVALESTIISHGMPYPRNIEVANLIESTVLDCGAIPATIAIIDGIPKIGLNTDEIVMLADSSRFI